MLGGPVAVTLRSALGRGAGVGTGVLVTGLLTGTVVTMLVSETEVVELVALDDNFKG